MLQGILLSMSSPWLYWGFFTQPIISSRGVRNGNDFKYPREPVPAHRLKLLLQACYTPVHRTLVSDPGRILPHISLKQRCKLLCAWLCQRTCVPHPTFYLIFLISSCIHLLNNYLLSTYYVPEVIQCLGYKNEKIKKKVTVFIVCPCKRWLFCMDTRKI